MPPPSSISDNNDEAYDAEIQVVNAFGPTDNVKATVDKTKLVDRHPMVESTRGPFIPTTVDRAEDGASIHSMPTVHVAEPSAPILDRPGPISPEPSHRSPPSSPIRSNIMHEEAASAHQRRARHLDSRATNRLSGFFTNLMQRREHTPVPSRDPARDSANPRPNSEGTSRPSSPTIPRPVTPPPPPLPAPTLQELGLSLSAITADLCPSHFSSPPNSGAFLSPHYLLLCHPQGLDVLPLVSPPAIQPYALVRRVNFKSIAVMEQRGVLVAIAGRRDGVRVYALEEIKRAIDWRVEIETSRERERQRREEVKKTLTQTSDAGADLRGVNEKHRKTSVSSSLGDHDHSRSHLIRKSSLQSSESHSSIPPVPLIPRSATSRRTKKLQQDLSTGSSNNSPQLTSNPPPYASELANPPLRRGQSYISLSASPQANNVLAQAPNQRIETLRNQDSKADWADSSDEEAIDAVAAGPSGTHLDERTSAILSAAAGHSIASPPCDPQPLPVSVPSLITTPSATVRRPRPSNLNLSESWFDTIPRPEPSPAPSLLTLRQALSQVPPSNNNHPASNLIPSAADADDDDEDLGGISLAQALLESRLPDLPPIGSRRPQEPILLTPRTTQGTPTFQDDDSCASRAHNNRRRRRWSFMINNSPTNDLFNPPASAPVTRPSILSRSQSIRPNWRGLSPCPSTEPTPVPASQVPIEMPSPVPHSSRSSRFLPRIISNVLHGRSSEERPSTSASLPQLSDGGQRWATIPSHQVPPQKLEYVKLPGTKGAVLIKAVETAKKSFLAILCGEHGEKVELFAGTYRTALGLSRTFILPDSPRSLELQLQGDDLVEVFLVFAHNVFGLEPATVRVREVRIGRAERRAARRRARENRLAGRVDPEPEEETSLNVSIGVSVPVIGNTGQSPNPLDRSDSPALIANEHPEEGRSTTPEPLGGSAATQGEEVLLTTTQMGQYSTFQQLSFAPRFPLSSIADEYIIPPTYPAVLEYKAQYETGNNKEDTLVDAQTQEQAHFTPPGLPVPAPVGPSRWYYRDPKNVVHGPWKASLMQAWYKDGLLPPELPVRREEDTEFILLRDLRLQCIDPTHPFRNAMTKPKLRPIPKPEKPLLSPISLLTQPKHFGPPALFYSSRGGHSTAIVDSRGRSVLKGKFLWSNDNDVKYSSPGRMGDIKRLEAFDVSERSLLVALRQGGLEVVDLGDALLKPADESRIHLPNYAVTVNAVGRRAPFVWKIGNPISSPTSTMVNAVTVTTTKGKGTFGHSSNKKTSVSSAKFVNGKADAYGIESETDQQDVLFLGRNEDDVYFCERHTASFRIIRLSPVS